MGRWVNRAEWGQGWTEDGALGVTPTALKVPGASGHMARSVCMTLLESTIAKAPSSVRQWVVSAWTS